MPEERGLRLFLLSRRPTALRFQEADRYNPRGPSCPRPKMWPFGKKYKCDVCGEKFGTQEKLDEHAKSHVQAQAPDPRQQTAG